QERLQVEPVAGRRRTDCIAAELNCFTFALLDDASVDPATGAGRPSRLYTGHHATLACSDFAAWPGVLAAMEQALAPGLHAVPIPSYERGHHIVGVPPRDGALPLAQILLFERCDELSQAEVADWLAAQAGNDIAPAGVAGIGANVAEAQFVDAIGRIRDYIAA